MKKKILFFGFSVTRYGNPPYPIRLTQLLEAEGVDDFEISFAALGGVGLECVPFIIERLKKFSPDYLFFEIGTSHYSLSEKSIEGTNEIFISIINQTASFCKKVIFLLLPREDIKNCKISASLNFLKLQNSFGIIDLQSILKENFVGYLVDNVHPSEMGIDYISTQIKNYLLSREPICLADSLTPSNKYFEFHLDQYAPHHKYPLLSSFEHSNFSVKAVPLKEGDQISFKFNHDMIVHGIFFLMGPDTSSLEVKLSGIPILVRTFDKHSYYYRIGFGSLYQNKFIKSGDSIEIISTENRLNTILDRDSNLKFNNITNYPFSLGCSLIE
jgi:hypothetical protein